MFEYLMPLLVMPSYRRYAAGPDLPGRRRPPDRVRPATRRAVGHFRVRLQCPRRPAQLPVPRVRRARTRSQARACDDLVIAPYATVLALMVAPRRPAPICRRLAQAGLAGRLRLLRGHRLHPVASAPGTPSAVVRIVHGAPPGDEPAGAGVPASRPSHAAAVHGEPSSRRTELLLQESASQGWLRSLTRPQLPKAGPRPGSRKRRCGSSTPAHADPKVHLLSNGRYHVMVTNAGAATANGRPCRHPLARGCHPRRWGSSATSATWRAGFWSPRTIQRSAADSYQAIFSQGRAEFRRRDHDIERRTEIVVSPEDDIEMRRSDAEQPLALGRRIELTSYAEVVLAPPAADAPHPAFSNLFVQTEIFPSDRRHPVHAPSSVPGNRPRGCSTCSRLPEGGTTRSYETDRMKFLGRGTNRAEPQRWTTGGTLGKPRARTRSDRRNPRIVTLSPTKPRRLTSSRVSPRHAKPCCWSRSTTTATRRSGAGYGLDSRPCHVPSVERDRGRCAALSSLASSIIYANPALAREPARPRQNRRGQSGLWGYGISGDLPIVLLRIPIAPRPRAAAGPGAHLLAREGARRRPGDLNEDCRLPPGIAGPDHRMIGAAPGAVVTVPAACSSAGRNRVRGGPRPAAGGGAGHRGRRTGRSPNRLNGASDGSRGPLLIPARPPCGATGSRRTPPSRTVVLQWARRFHARRPRVCDHDATGQSTPAPWVNVLANPHSAPSFRERPGLHLE